MHVTSTYKCKKNLIHKVKGGQCLIEDYEDLLNYLYHVMDNLSAS